MKNSEYGNASYSGYFLVKALAFAGLISLMVNSCSHNPAPLHSNYKLQAPSPPFKRVKSEKKGLRMTKELVLSGRSIQSGSAEVLVSPCGEISFISEGLELFKLYAYVNSKWSCGMTNQKSKAVIPRAASIGRLAVTESTVDDEKRVFRILGHAPLLKLKSGEIPQASFEQVVAARPDGKVAINYTFKLAEKHRNLLNGLTFLLELPYSVYSDGVVTVGKRQQTMANFSTKTPASLVFAPGDSRTEFGLEVESQGCIKRIQKKKLNKVICNFIPERIEAGKGKPDGEVTYKLSLSLDPMTGHLEAKSRKCFAGVDFKKVDDLEVPDYAFCSNLLRNPSFERGRMFISQNYYSSKYAAVDQIKIDAQESLFGQHSLLLEGNQEDKTHFSFMLSPVPVEPGDYTLSFHAKYDKPDSVDNLSVSVFSSGFQNIIRKRFKLTQTWQRQVLTFKVKSPGAVVPFFGCVVKRSGKVWLDGVQLERGEKGTAFVNEPLAGLLLTSSKRNFLSTGAKINARLRLISNQPETKGHVAIKVKDFFGETLYNRNYSFNTGSESSITLPLDFENKFGKGIFMLSAEYKLDSGRSLKEFFRFSIMDFMEGKHRNRKMFSNSYNASMNDVHPSFATYLERCRRLGVGSENNVGFPTPAYTDLLREYGLSATNTSLLNRVPARDNKGKIKERFRIYDKGRYAAGTKLLLRDFNVTGTGTLDQAYIDRLDKCLEEKAKLYPGAMYYDLMGEMVAKNPDWYRKDLKSFVDFHVAGYRAIQKAGKKITNSSTCNIEPRDGIRKIENQLKAYAGRIKFDALCIHPYIPAGPYALENKIEAFLDMIAKYGYVDTPVFFPEGMHYGPYDIPRWGVVSASWGPPRTWFGGTLSYDMGWTEKRSAAWFARSWLTCMKFMPQVFSACSGVQNMISNFQLDIDMTPRAYQKIPNTLSRLLGNARFVKDVSFAPECKCLVFEDDKERPVVALWGKNQKVDFGFKSGSRACTDFADLKPEVFDLMENKREIIPDRDGKVMIPVSAFPFFFRGEPGKTAEYCEIFAKAQISDGLTIPLNLNFKTTSSEEIELMVRNLISRQVEGVLTVNDERRKINVEPGAAESFPVKLPQPLRTDKIIEELVPVLLEEKGNPAKLNSTISFPGFLCRKSDGPFKIDGSLEDWRGIPSISLINKNLSKRYGSRNYPEDDFKGQFRVAWDKNNLYLAVEITDNHFVHKEDYPGTPGHRWNNDSMQIYFDTFCDARQKSESGYFGYDANDYDFAVFPNATGDDARVFRFYAVDRQLAMGVEIFKENVFEPNISSAFKKTKNGYVYELAFPAKYILPVKLENGYSIGFGLYVNDRDLEKHVKQALTLTPPDTGCYRSPHLYPVMLLTE